MCISPTINHSPHPLCIPRPGVSTTQENQPNSEKKKNIHCFHKKENGTLYKTLLGGVGSLRGCDGTPDSSTGTKRKEPNQQGLHNHPEQRPLRWDPLIGPNQKP